MIFHEFIIAKAGQGMHKVCHNNFTTSIKKSKNKKNVYHSNILLIKCIKTSPS